MGNRFWDWMTLGSYCAIIYVMVRPGSQGPGLVTAITNGLTNLTNAQTGGGGWAAK